MPDILWPTSLPQVVNKSGFNYKPGDTTIRSEMEVGPDKIRRRSTRPVDTMSLTMNVTQAQYTTLYTFWDVDLNGGVNQFVFNHPITGVAKYCRMVGPPSFTPLGGVNFIAQMTFEILP